LARIVSNIEKDIWIRYLGRSGFSRKQTNHSKKLSTRGQQVFASGGMMENVPLMIRKRAIIEGKVDSIPDKVFRLRLV